MRAGNGKLQVVYAHDFQALRVHNLAVHKVARKQHLVGLQIAEADVVRLNLQRDAVVVEFVDVLTPRDHERDFARPLEGQAGDTRKNLARRDGKIGNGADFLTG